MSEKVCTFAPTKIETEMKIESEPNERGTLKWWVHLIIGILSAIAGALGGTLVIAPLISNTL